MKTTRHAVFNPEKYLFVKKLKNENRTGESYFSLNLFSYHLPSLTNGLLPLIQHLLLFAARVGVLKL